MYLRRCEKLTIVYKFINGNEKSIKYDDPAIIEKTLNEIKFFITTNVINKKIDLTKDIRSKFNITVDGEEIRPDSNKIVSIEIKL